MLCQPMAPSHCALAACMLGRLGGQAVGGRLAGAGWPQRLGRQRAGSAFTTALCLPCGHAPHPTQPHTHQPPTHDTPRP